MLSVSESGTFTIRVILCLIGRAATLQTDTDKTRDHGTRTRTEARRAYYQLYKYSVRYTLLLHQT